MTTPAPSAVEPKASSDRAALIADLEAIAAQQRIEIVKMVYRAQSGHPGGSLSAIDYLTVMYFHWLRHNPQEPRWPDRDRLVYSKGHSSPALYASLSRAGYFPHADLKGFRQVTSHLEGHPDFGIVPGVEVTTGSLGHGLSVGNGMALALKLNNSSARVYPVLSDGETQEGMTWEAALTAAHHSLDNVCAFTDYNRIQLDGFVDDIKKLDPLPDKWRAFGWHVREINGHDMNAILDALEEMATVTGKPQMIVANTVKGKGVSFMENNPKFHGVAPNDEEFKQAMTELGATREQLEDLAWD